MSNRKFIVLLGVYSFVAFVLGLIYTLNGDFSKLTYFFFPLLIFIWGDALIIGIFLTLLCIWLYNKNRSTITGLFLFAYLSVRSFIEIIYVLNAQFSSTIRPWEINWRDSTIIKHLDINEVYVISQLFFTCLFIIFIINFIFFLKKYLKT